MTASYTYVATANFNAVTASPVTFAITAAVLTVTASSAAITVGATYPAVTYSTGLAAVTSIVGVTCAVYASATSTPALTGVSVAGSYVTRCAGGTPTANYTIGAYVSGVLLVNPPTILYTGSTLIAPGGAITRSASMTFPTTCTGAYTYTLDRNPLTGVVGSYTLPTTSTTSWLNGVYIVTVVKAATTGVAACPSVSVSTSTLTVQSVATTVAATAARAYGGGQYTVAGTQRVSVGFQISGSTPTGQFTFIQTNTWKFVGTLSTYSRTGAAAPFTGTSTGTGNLSYWNTATSAWVSVGSAISVSIVFTSGAGTATGTGTLATTFGYTPITGQPALPTTSAQRLGTTITANA